MNHSPAIFHKTWLGNLAALRSTEILLKLRNPQCLNMHEIVSLAVYRTCLGFCAITIFIYLKTLLFSNVIIIE